MSNVISLAEERHKRGHSALRGVEEYWRTLAGGAVPLRNDLRPRSMGAVLSHVAVLERIAPGHARIRVAGTMFSDLMGMEVKGMPFSVLFEPQARPELRHIVELVTENPARGHLSLRSSAAIGRPGLGGQMVMLPMANAQGSVDTILCAIALDPGPLGRAPRRFSIPDSFVRRIDGAAVEVRP